MNDTTYFGLAIIDAIYVRLIDIQSLPFFDFWKESSAGSTMVVVDGETRIFLADWVAFSTLFIETGRHRFQAGNEPASEASSIS